MAKKMKKEILNREMGDGAAGSVKQDMSHDPGRAGYHRSDMGGVEKVNYRIEDGYKKKEESPDREEGSSIHDIAHHSVTNELYSGHPERHGHFGKVYMKGEVSDGSDEARHGGGGHEEND